MPTVKEKILAGATMALVLEGAAVLRHTTSQPQVSAVENTSCPSARSFLQPDIPSGNPLRDLGAFIIEKIEPNSAYGTYLDRTEDGVFVPSPCPVPVPIMLISKPILAEDHLRTANTIAVFQKPSMNAQQVHDLSTQSLRVFWGVRVLGSSIPNHDLGNINVTINGQVFKGGLWFIPTTSDGQPIYPTNGRVLTPKEGAYYVNASYVNLRPIRAART